MSRGSHWFLSLFFLTALLCYPSAPAAAAPLPEWKWPSGAIPVCWANLVGPGQPHYDEQQTRRKWVKDAVEGNWGAFTPLDFTGWGPCKPGSEAGIQINIMWDGKTASNSYVGRAAITAMQARGTPGVNLQLTPNFNTCLVFSAGCVISAALHEFGHALGFSHEHRRPGARPGFICKLEHPPGKGDPLLTKADKAVFVSGSYDSNSIMNYCPELGGLFDSISEADVLGVQKHYGPSPKGPLYAKAQWRGNHSCERKFPKTSHRTAAFRHQLSGECWACPSGYGRSINPDIRAPTACAKGLAFKPAIDVGKWGCPAGSFKNGLYDQCFSCPAAYDRTAVIGLHLDRMPRACVRHDWGLAKMLTINLRPH